ncbi:STAS domain-containing protein [Streptomyces spiralis]|uniref:STAS domain-containing protein n=1 Tax=Streptomyces spiralis TaxID=66376 RepID=UPI0033C0F6CC
MHPEFHISQHEEDDWTVVEIEGEADVFTVPHIREHVIKHMEHGRYRFIVDLRRVTFMDSTGLGVLVSILKRIRVHDGQLRLVIASREIHKIFQITGLHRVFSIYDSLDDAMTAR